MLPTILLLNGIVDIITVVDPTGTSLKFLSAGAFRTLHSEQKELVVLTTVYSFLTHGLIRVLASQNLKEKNMRFAAMISYACEVIHFLKLLHIGAVALPESAPFIVAPIAAIVMLYRFKDNKND